MTRPKPRGLLSGATIRDTLIGVLKPLSKTQTHVKATGPTKAPGLLPNLEERKGLKEAQHVAHSHPSQAHRTISAPLEGSESTLGRVTHLRLARGLPSDPRPRNRISASLEDSGPALERVASLRLARGQRTCPRAGGQSPPRSRPSLGTRDKWPRRPTDRRTKALKASYSATAQRTGGVRLPLPQWM
jgi:hypothetical protein